jgi:hypothetical protein
MKRFTTWFTWGAFLVIGFLFGYELREAQVTPPSAPVSASPTKGGRAGHWRIAKDGFVRWNSYDGTVQIHLTSGGWLPLE